MKTEEQKLPEKLTEARIQLMITEDILLRAPIWALVVIIFLGGISFGTVWFIINIIKPYMESILQ